MVLDNIDPRQLAAHGADLDEQLRVVENGKVVLCVAMTAAFYFHDGDKPDTRNRLAQAFDRYHSATGGALRWGVYPDSRATEPLAGTEMTNLHAWVPRLASQDDAEFFFHGASKKDDASPYTVESVFGPIRRPKELSYLLVSLPFAWVASQPAGAFTKLVVEIADLLRPYHGHAGLGIVPHIDFSRDTSEMQHVLALIARFRGLEYDLPWTYLRVLQVNDRIKNIDWLTILDQSWIDRLGGRAALETELGPTIEWHPFKSGVVLQAGPRPLFGDKHYQEPMEDYGRVARSLKPIRIESIKSLSLAYGFDEDRTIAWLNRFDG